MIIKLLQGAFIGVALVLPGLSAGTVILIMGFYRRLLDDLAALRIKPYLPLALGVAAGGLAGVYTVSYLLERFNPAITAFLLGMLLASVPLVINHERSTPIRPWPVFIAVIGFLTAWFFICEPTRTFTVLPPGGLFHFFVGGTLASATMLLPGVSGSSVLIILNLYDDVIFAISRWQWLKLLFLAAGFVVGLFGLARLLSALYRRYRTEVSFLLAGLILGSTRPLLPDRLTIVFFIFAALGAFVVLYFTRHQIRANLKRP